MLMAGVETVRSRLSATRKADGGLSRVKVLDAAKPQLEELGFTVGAPDSVRIDARTKSGSTSVAFDATHAGVGVAVTVHAGRAWTNHEAVMAVLRMAAAEDVRTGVLIVPEHYKGSIAAANVIQCLRDMAGWEGVWLDLEGVAVLSY